MYGGVVHEDLEPAADLLRVLSAPVRLAIIGRLAEGAAPVHVLTSELGDPQPLVSHHLGVLRGARLVRARNRGRERVYELVDEHVAHIVRDAVMHTTESANDSDAHTTTEERP